MDDIERFRYGQACSWLANLRRLRRAVDSASDAATSLEAIAQQARAVDYTRPHVTSQRADRLADTIERLESVRGQLAANMAALSAEAADAALRLQSLPNPAESQALTLHYVDGMEWADVARRMGYSEQRIYQIREAAALHAYDVMPLEWRDDEKAV